MQRACLYQALLQLSVGALQPLDLSLGGVGGWRGQVARKQRAAHKATAACSKGAGEPVLQAAAPVMRFHHHTKRHGQSIAGGGRTPCTHMYRKRAQRVLCNPPGVCQTPHGCPVHCAAHARHRHSEPRCHRRRRCHHHHRRCCPPQRVLARKAACSEVQAGRLAGAHPPMRAAVAPPPAPEERRRRLQQRLQRPSALAAPATPHHPRSRATRRQAWPRQHVRAASAAAARPCCGAGRQTWGMNHLQLGRVLHKGASAPGPRRRRCCCLNEATPTPALGARRWVRACCSACLAAMAAPPQGALRATAPPGRCRDSAWG
jgi:hypothetical protein